ncbi:uncharacterized protein LOC134249896 [Saccostrea cucullata]|uniref:uncharacterized protein LOC134249896 n=1 Tax=Saccostrea cuccullata TaxID=36930 RepID=UPI002ED4C122
MTRKIDTKTLQVKETDFCPTNQSSWERASRYLNCTSPDRYQCTSNENQTSLLEYCYDEPPTFVLKGYCWILLDVHYVHTFNCSGFTEGCPNETYRSDELYKYRQCLQLNKLEGCFQADEKCLKEKKTIIQPSYEGSSSNTIAGVATATVIIFIIIAIIVTLVWRKTGGCTFCKEQNVDEECYPLETTPTVHIEADRENVVLRCIPTEKQRKTLSNAIWLKDGKEIKLNDRNGRYSLTSDKLTLVIENANHVDIGEYICCFKYANEYESIVRINLDRPKLTLKRIEFKGQNVSIEYEVSKECFSLTSLSWRKNRCSLKLSDEPEKYSGGKLDDSFLKIHNVNDGSSGIYECTVNNVFGEDSISCVLDDIQCSSKENQSILLCCLLQDEFRICKTQPEQWKEKLEKSCLFCFGHVKGFNAENALASVEDGKSNKHFDIKDRDFRLINPDKVFQSFLRINGFLDFFVKHSTTKNIGIYCRSSGYQRGLDEVCINVNQEQFKKMVQRLKFDILFNNTIADKTCHQIIENELSIPKGILSLGKEGISNYIDSLKTGEHRVYVARGMLVGCEGVGKTSLLYRLQGKDNPNPSSTIGLDVHVNLFTVQGESLNVTANINKPSLLSNLNNEELAPSRKEKDIRPHTHMVDEKVNNNKSFPTPPQILLENAGYVLEKKDNFKTKQSEISSHSVTSSEPSAGKRQPSTGKNEVIKEEIENMDTCHFQSDEENAFPVSDITIHTLSDSFTEKDRKIVSFFDFAGQFSYYACHHVYFSPNDFYILVMDITKKLGCQIHKEKTKGASKENDITEELNEESNRMKGSVYSDWTVLEFSEYWIQSILSHTTGLAQNDEINEEVPKKAPLILVATHAEGKYGKLGEQYFLQLRSKLPHLSAYIDYSSNAFSTGFHDDIQKIKNCIMNIVQKLPNWGKIIPMSWFHVESLTRKLKNMKIISFENFYRKCIESSIGIRSHKDLITSLRFLNDIGVVLFYDEDYLRSFVILDVQWFVNAFKHAITDETHKSIHVDEKLYNQWTSFNETGLLTFSLLKSIWQGIPERDSYISNKKEIIACMIRLNLLTEVLEETWYCPCMNKKPFPVEQFKKSDCSSLLCFQFTYLPLDMYHRIIAACGNQLKWKVFKLKEYCIYQMATLFHVNESEVLVGIYNNNEIVVQFLELSKSKNVDHVGVREKITQVITNLAEKLVCCKYNVGYMCKKAIFGKPNQCDLHFIAESDLVGESIRCSDCGIGSEIIVKEIIWRKTFGENQQDNHTEDQRHVSLPNIWNYFGRPHKDKLVLAAIDIGTTFSGCALIFTKNIQKDPLDIIIPPWQGSKINSLKAPTLLLLNRDKKCIAFGYKAEKMYTELKCEGKHLGYYYFREFTWLLDAGLTGNEMIKDIRGKKLPLVELLSLVIKGLYMQCDQKLKLILRDELIPDEIAWLLTVPSHWNDSGKQLMKTAALRADMRQQNMCIELESVAASVYYDILSKHGWKGTPSYIDGKYLLLDAGGKKLELHVYEVSHDGNLLELDKKLVKDIGGIIVDQALETFLSELFGLSKLNIYRARYFEDYIDILNEFEVRKRSFGEALKEKTDIYLYFPESFVCFFGQYNSIQTQIDETKYMGHVQYLRGSIHKLMIDFTTFSSFFVPVCDKIVQHVQTMLALPILREVDKIFMIGGFSESAILQNAVKDAFPKCSVVAVEPEIAVLKGAVLMGRGFNSI